MAVTGAGVVTPAGSSAQDAWHAVLAAKSLARPIRHLDVDDLPVRFACEVDDLAGEGLLDAKEARRLARSTQLGLVAGLRAVGAAGDPRVSADRRAIVVGTGVGGLAGWEPHYEAFAQRGAKAVSPFTVPMFMPSATAVQLAIRLGWSGPNMSVTPACAAGAAAIGEGVRLIRDGSAEVVLAGGTEALVSRPVLAAFARTGALSTRNEDPAGACRPFDADRDGFVMGEGAAFVVLERLDSALERGANILGTVLGYATTSDAYHVTAPAPGGRGAAQCMRLALADAGLDPGDIVHVNAHGTSTPLNDDAEALALSRVFGEAVPPVTAPKGVVGHMIGASGAFEAIISLQIARCGVVPPVANFEKLGTTAEIDVVAHEPRMVAPGPGLSNSFAFGGQNVTLVLAPPA